VTTFVLNRTHGLRSLNLFEWKPVQTLHRRTRSNSCGNTSKIGRHQNSVKLPGITPCAPVRPPFIDNSVGRRSISLRRRANERYAHRYGDSNTESGGLIQNVSSRISSLPILPVFVSRKLASINARCRKRKLRCPRTRPRSTRSFLQQSRLAFGILPFVTWRFVLLQFPLQGLGGAISFSRSPAGTEDRLRAPRRTPEHSGKARRHLLAAGHLNVRGKGSTHRAPPGGFFSVTDIQWNEGTMHRPDFIRPH